MAADTTGISESSYGVDQYGADQHGTDQYDADRQPNRNNGNDRGFWNRWSWAFFCGLFSIVGAISLIPSVGALVGEITLRRDCTEITDGTVTQMIFNPTDPSDDDSSDSWTPVFRYGVSGRIYEQRYSVASSDPWYEVGDAVTIRYDPADPNRYVVEGDHAPLMLYAAITVIFLGFTAVLPVAIAIKRR
ncbi:DUF3592 domain-containing protein [Bifidobacterium jacchi]|nr:DUF3592 domain-containing protein [Bifidobacterium jacchi]